MKIINNVFIGKLIYGSIFIIFLPLFLFIWAQKTNYLFTLKIPSNYFLIYSLIILGSFFILSGMLHLIKFGKGLPMIAFPPRFYVTKGIYSLFKNPIYIGCGLLSFGLSLFFQSKSGFWFISPYFCLMMLAYTIGFENEKTNQFFKESKNNTLLNFYNDYEKPSFIQQIKIFILVFVPWIVFYEIFIFIGIQENSIITNIEFDKYIPLIDITIIPYLLTYPLALLIPFILKNKHILFEFLIDIWFAILLTTMIYFLFPFIVIQKVITNNNIFTNFILWDRSFDSTSAALPSYHVIWGLLIYKFYSISFPKYKMIWLIIGILIIISCITTGNHTIFDVLAGIVVFLLSHNRILLWNKIRNWNENIANKWLEFNFGNYRLIYHGFYPAISVLLGIIIINSILGKSYYITVFIVGISGILGAAIWAQLIEGSNKLQRPFGYYGSVIGVLISCFIISYFWNIDSFLLIASFAIGACIMQSIGRLRCIVQGCCHGKITSNLIGIRYHNPLSRVNTISNLSNEYLHPTQTYSIFSNIICFFVLLKFYFLGFSASFIIGNYFIINGIFRFVEEFYRGETQTKYYFNMRLYQWIAIINILLGAFFTMIHSNPLPSLTFNIDSMIWAILLGLISLFTYGFDIPNSQKRFSKLTQ